MVEGKKRHSNIALSLESKVFILPPRTISHRNAELKTCAIWATARSFPFRQEETQMGSPRLTEAPAYVDRDGFFCGLIQMGTDSYLFFSLLEMAKHSFNAGGIFSWLFGYIGRSKKNAGIVSC